MSGQPVRQAARLARMLRRHRRRLAATALDDLTEVSAGHYVVRGPAPRWSLGPWTQPAPHGWVRLRIDGASDTAFDLAIDSGTGWREHRRLALEGSTAIVHLPPGLRGLSLQPRAPVGRGVRMAQVSLVEITRQEALTVLAARHVARRPQALTHLARHVVRRGFGHALHTLACPADADYARWIARYDTLDGAARGRIAARIATMGELPRISVVMPVYNAPERFLRQAIESVRAQLYPAWQLCVADDCSPAPHVARLLAHYEGLDGRIRVVRRRRNGHIVAASNDALALADGAFVALLDHDDLLPPHALYRVAEAIAAHPRVGLIFSDEDKIDEDGRRYHPYFKPDFDPDLLASQNTISHLGVYRRDLVEAVGGFRAGMEGSQDYDLALRVTRRLTLEQVQHIPHVLYHWRAMAGSTARATTEKPYAYRAAERALADHVAPQGADVVPSPVRGVYRVRYPLPEPAPAVRLLVQAPADAGVLARCLQAWLPEARQVSARIVVYGADASGSEAVAAAHGAAWADGPCAAAAMAAGDEVWLWLAGDLRPVAPGTLCELVTQAARPEVGAATGKVLHLDDTVEQGGLVLGVADVAGHAHEHLAAAAPGYFGRALATQNVAALRFDCVAMRRAAFAAVGPFDAQLPALARDIDMSLRLRRRGLRLLFTPHAVLRRQSQTPVEPLADMHRAILVGRWGAALFHDPFHNPNLSGRAAACEGALAFPPRQQAPWPT